MDHAVDDPIVSVLPIHLSTSLHPAVHIHQFPLLTRPLQVPSSAANAGKTVHARLKAKASRIEVHLPVDTRPEIWNEERSEILGQARIKDDSDKNSNENDDDRRLTEVRYRSELVPHKGAYMLGVMRDGQLHLHPIGQTHQLRPSLAHVDAYHSKSRKGKADPNDGSESDEGFPQDQDDSNASVVGKKPLVESKDVTVSVRKVEERGMQSMMGGLSTVRREMVQQMREEEEEPWQTFQYFDAETDEAAEAFEGIFSNSQDELECQSDLAGFLKSIPGL